MNDRQRVLLFFFLASGIRLFFNFGQELIPGVNGGYYPVQVRAMLESGSLAFPDMPLLFRLNAVMVSFLSLFGFPVSDALILAVVKVTDSVSLPLLLFPTGRLLRAGSVVPLLRTAIMAFSVLSFSPLVLVSDLQKNALAVVFLAVFLAYLPAYSGGAKKRDMILSIAFLALAGLTHFGTFAFGLFFLLLYLLFAYRRRAVVPALALMAAGSALVAFYDPTRFGRMVSWWNVVFDKPALLNGMVSPPDIFVILLSLAMAATGIIILQRGSIRADRRAGAVVFAAVVSLLTCSFPFLDGEYFARLSLFLFLPQVLVLSRLPEVAGVKGQNRAAYLLLGLTALSALTVAGRPKQPVISHAAWEDLPKMRTSIPGNRETLVIARHGLEWWAAWALHTKVGQDKSIDRTISTSNREVFFLNQTGGFGDSGQRTPFHEPAPPAGAAVVFASAYFKLYRLPKGP